MIKPIASVKKLFVSLNLAADVPEYAIGDEKRLMQTLLNVVGNAVKFTKEGTISITAFVAKSESLRDPRAPDFLPVPSENHFYLRVQVGPLLLFRDLSCDSFFSSSTNCMTLFYHTGKRYRSWNKPPRYP